MVLRRLQEYLADQSTIPDFQDHLRQTQYGMVYRDIKREDFDDALKALGNDPAILEHQTPADHLESKNKDPWTSSKHMSNGLATLQGFKLAALSPSLLVIILGLIAVLSAILILIMQVQSLNESIAYGSEQAKPNQAVTNLQVSIQELRDQSEEQYEDLMELLNKLGQRPLTSPQPKIQKKIATDPDETDLKKWRHMGIGSNQAGSYAIVYDGQQTRFFSKNTFVKPQWQMIHFDSQQIILQGPEGKQLIIASS